MCFININRLILIKMWTKLIQQYVKEITHQNQVGFIPRMEDWYINGIHHIIRLKEKLLILIDTKKKITIVNIYSW